MSCKLARDQEIFGRRQSGSQVVEFGPALMILIGMVVIPMLDLTIVPVRWMLAHELVNEYSRKLALCETFSQSRNCMNADPSLKTRLQKLGGVFVKSIHMNLRIARVFKAPHPEEVLVVEDAGRIPAAWLPNGAKAPCLYSINLEVDSAMAPAVMFPKNGGSLPGLNEPIPLRVSSSHEWENFGRDPINGKYFLNQ